MKRAVIFSTAYAPLVGGAEIAVREITDRLLDWEFVLITARIKSELPEIEMIGRVKVVRVGTGSRFDKINLWLKGYQAAAREGKFDLAWGIMASFGGLGALRFKKKNLSVPFLLTLQEGDSFAHIYARAALIWPWFKQIFTKADQVQAISNYLASWAKRMGATCPITVIPNGIDHQRFYQRPATERAFDQAWLKNKLGLQSTEKIILTVSRLVPKNAVEDLIKALALLPAGAHLVIAGSGEREVACRELVKKLQLDARVHFLGTIANQDLPQYLSGSDVFCRPSLSEGLGISFLEAMAMGVPTVATLVGGIPDFLQDGVTGFACSAGSPQSIATALQKALRAPESIAVNATRVIAERFVWNEVTKQMNGVFSRSLNESIVLATGVYPPEIGGPASYVANLEPEFKALDFETQVVTFGNQQNNSLVIRVARTGNSVIRYWRYFWHLFKATKTVKIVYAFDITSVGIPAWLVTKIRKIPLVVRVGGDFLWEKAFNEGLTQKSLAEYYHPFTPKTKVERVIKWLGNVVLKNSVGIIFSSHRLHQIYTELYQFPHAKVKIIENPVTKSGAVVQNYEPVFDLVFVGRLIRLKNIAGVINSLLRTKYRLAIMGDGPERESLRQLVKSKGLENQITFFSTGSKVEVQKLILNSRALIIPSFFEASPNTLLEALQLGRPVICTIETEYAKKFAPALELCDPCSEDSIRLATATLLGSAEYYNRKQTEAVKIAADFAEQNYRHVAELHLALFKEISE